MRKITLFLAFVACVTFTQAQTLLVENFDYSPSTELLGQGSWALTGSAADPTIKVTASSITYPSYLGSGIGNEVTLENGQDLNKAFAPQTTGTVYTSFIVNIAAAPKNGDYFFHLGAETMGSAYIGRTFVKADATDGKIIFGILQASGGGASYAATAYNLNTTYLIVLKHNIETKTSSIIVNPDMTAEPTVGWTSNNEGTNATANIGSVGLRQPSPSAALNAKLDGIRVAKSWDVLFPTTGLNTTEASKFKAVVVGKELLVSNTSNGATVEIFSTLGSKVQSSVLSNGRIELNSLAKGMYIVRVGKQTQKIML